ncbi:Isoquinoline 1-oxidoreductase subunit [Chelatococcus sambhunathii]|uniref:Isoquinoline 1-oxidoreductase subunit n=1 Tax=Chelatococcus sambhunathii TaxID=363953 RepID=A0ABU1DJX4_9HYPH|nr:Isoquinoline 1-oxidoreductase subunit [Chelatococcus sambhunathii]MDR4308416.1 Isoquinoline 1-oxidoreductase subunit [Chelatococcus sambhunathii]
MRSLLARFPRAGFASLAAGVLSAALLSFGSGAVDKPAAPAPDPRPLQGVASFQSVSDKAERSRALFTEAAKVITDPRCMNCHPSANRVPTQGDDMHPHVPFINAGDSGIGSGGLSCGACHRADNTTLAGARLIKSIPGANPWLLAPHSMGWQGLTLGEICGQLKDPGRNGGRTLSDIRRHMSEDHLVGWAWHPGEGRRPAPGTQQAFGALISAWIETGAECPS